MTRRLKSSLLVVLAFSILAGAAIARHPAAQGRVRFTEAEVFFELNETDGDLGIHASVDGGQWTELAIDGPGDRMLLDIVSRGRLRSQGLTQLFFESAEPPFDVLAPDEFFRRFPEGRYEIEARLQDGGEVTGTALLSHVLAGPPQNVTVSGVPAAESCDAPVLPNVFAPVTIRWDPVTGSHPELGKRGPVQISRYQLFVEQQNIRLSLDLPPTVTEFEIPTAVTDLGDEFKFEIIVRTAAGNNTAVESCFAVQ
jgi:hypothetical protein